MTLTTTLNTFAAKFSVWTTQNPVAARAIMLTVPFLAAAVAALVTRQPVFACSGPVGAAAAAAGKSRLLATSLEFFSRRVAQKGETARISVRR